MDDRFVKVSDVEAIPMSQMARFRVNGTWVLVINLNGEFFAIADTCSHEEASLFKGVLKDDCIRCPLHGSRFDIRTGHPLEDPAEVPVEVYPVKVETGYVYIGPASAS